MGKHTDDYFDALESLDVDVSYSEVESWLRWQSITQQVTGIPFDWTFTRTHDREDAAKEYLAMFNAEGQWQQVMTESNVPDLETYRRYVLGHWAGEEDDDLFEPPTDTPPLRSITLAASFPGTKYIVEYEDYSMYIPESRYCGIRAIAKSIGIPLNQFMNVPGSNANNMSIKDCFKFIEQYALDNYSWIIKEHPNFHLLFNVVDGVRTFKREYLPEIYTCRPGTKQLRRIPPPKACKDVASINPAAIVPVRIYSNVYHLCVVKNSNLIESREVTIESIYKNIKTAIKTELDGDCSTTKKQDANQFWKLLEGYREDKIATDCIVYDIETYINFEKPKGKATFASKKMSPYAIGWMHVEYRTKQAVDQYGIAINPKVDAKYMDNMTKEQLEAKVNIISPGPTTPNPVDSFWDAMSMFCLENFPARNWLSEPMVVYAHNGGNFDHHFVKESDRIRFIRTIRKGGKIKSLTAKHIETGVTFKLLDSYAYTGATLAKSCESMGVPECYWKIPFDIIDKTRAWYLANNPIAPYDVRVEYTAKWDAATTAEFEALGIKSTPIKTQVDEEIKKENDWYTYLKYDVISVGYVMFKFASNMLDIFNLQVNSCTGIPGLAWKLMLKNCSPLNECYTAMSDVNEHFMRLSAKGGRVMHLIKEFNAATKGIPGISLDINSLYPKAMESGVYPVGIPSTHNYPPGIINPQLIDGWIKNNNMFIAEIAYVTGNQRNPLHPYKVARKGETIGGVKCMGGSLLYPQCNDRENPLIDVCTSVDIIEMLKDGYEVLYVKRAIVWRETSKIFSPLIGKLYEIRSKLKAMGNPLEGTYKLVMNSAYGKFLEMIDEMVSFMSEDKAEGDEFKTRQRNGEVREVNKCVNGQLEYSQKILHPKASKPTYIGAFILSYSKVIANEYIRKIGIENIWYSDTDSFYTDNVGSVVQSSELGGIKNDYGENKFISQAIFVDYKRYYLEIEKKNKSGEVETSIVAKFNGLSIPKKLEKDMLFQTNVIDFDENPDLTIKQRNYKMLKEFFQFFKDNPQKVNERAVLQDKWIRGKVCRIDEKVFQYQVDPDKRGQWVDGKWFPIGFRFDMPICTAQPPKEYAHAIETKKVVSVKSTRVPHKLPYIIKENEKYGGTTSFESIKRHLTKRMQGKEFNDDIFDQAEAFFVTKAGVIVRKEAGQFYSVDCFGVCNKVEKPLDLMAIAFGLMEGKATIDGREICSPTVDCMYVMEMVRKLLDALQAQLHSASANETKEINQFVETLFM